MAGGDILFSNGQTTHEKKGWNTEKLLVDKNGSNRIISNETYTVGSE